MLSEKINNNRVKRDKVFAQRRSKEGFQQETKRPSVEGRS